MNARAEWAAALQSGYADAMLRLYDEKAVLWGTLSQIRRADHEQIRKYFESLMTYEGIRVEFTSSLIRHYGDMAINTGTYTFPGAKETGMFPSRPGIPLFIGILTATGGSSTIIPPLYRIVLLIVPGTLLKPDL